VRLFADTNIVAPAVRALRKAGHDVIYSAERPSGPGDAALLSEAAADRRVFLTKDHDIGALVHRDGQPHAGVLLLDDVGDAAIETALILAALTRDGALLAAGAFLSAPVSVPGATRRKLRASRRISQRPALAARWRARPGPARRAM